MATRFADGFNPAEGIVRVVTAERPLMKNLKRTVIAVVTSMSSIVLSVGAISVGASAAHASTGISGQVQCVDELAVEGVWIQASSGGSGFASLQNLNGYTKNFRYSLPHGGAWTVHVGCGGGTSDWLYKPNGNSTTTATYKSWLCITPDDDIPWPYDDNYCRQD
jgi:hypothetical protein